MTLLMSNNNTQSLISIYLITDLNCLSSLHVPWGMWWQEYITVSPVANTFSQLTQAQAVHAPVKFLLN